MSPPQQVTLTIDDREVTVPAGTSLFDAARLADIPIPTLCHLQNETPVGVCRLCVVEVERARVLQASCVRPAENGMVVHTFNDKVNRVRRTLLELLMSEHPSPCTRQRQSGDCELEVLAAREGVSKPRFGPRVVRRLPDDSSLAIAVDHDACILCDRCIRGCNEIRKNFVLGRMGKGSNTGIAFDHNQPMGASTCVSCGECMVSCPTGALTNKRTVTSELAGTPAPIELLQELPVFRGVSGTFLKLNQGSVVLRKYQPGETVCKEGEFGATAFYILEGTARVFLQQKTGHVKTEGGSTGFLSKLKSVLVGREEHVREEEGDRGTIPIDGPVDLEYGNPLAELSPGELFGEMTCMSFYPRSATVQAVTECVMLEMLRNVLDVMQKNKNFKERLEKNYRERALNNHLRTVPMFRNLTSDFIDHLRERVELQRFQPGQTIVKQGDPAESFYLVRMGFVKVSESYPGGELVLAYLGRGSYFGEIGLLGGGVRTATCSALDHVEVVKISGDDFNMMMEQFPEIRQSLQKVAQEREHENRRRLTMVSSVPLDSFLAQGLMEAQSLLLLDLERCTRCDACVRACADAHDGITRLVREGLRYDKYLVATSCRSCRDPYCMVGCPVGSIRRRNSLEVIIEDWCIGCGLCAKNCPYGNINLHPFPAMVDDPDQPGRKIAGVRMKATSCDLCTEHAEPSCVYACPHDAAHRVEPLQFFKEQLGITVSELPKR
jgi:CRP-like cAMP-binding protein/ferredoxin